MVPAGSGSATDGRGQYSRGKQDLNQRGYILLSHMRLVSLCDSSGSCCSLFPLRLISVTERMCAHEKFGFRREIRSSKLLRGMLI